MKNKMSIADAMRESFIKGHGEDQAIVYVRARIHIPKVSDKRLREYYQTTVKAFAIQIKINGPMGSGKSTLAQFVAHVLRVAGSNVTVKDGNRDHSDADTARFVQTRRIEIEVEQY